MLIRTVFILSLVAFIIWFYQQLKEGLRLLAITNAMSEARKTFVEWQYHNPGVYIGLSPEGRKLLIRYLHTYDAWLVSHNLTDRNHFEKLAELLNDFPPKEPNGMPPGTPKKPCDNIKGLLSFPSLDFPTSLSHTAWTKEASGGFFCIFYRFEERSVLML